MISAEEWDTRYIERYHEALLEEDDLDRAALLAERETREQFGDRPAEETT